MTKQQRLTSRITLRLPDITAAEWRERAESADLSISDWVRHRVENSDVLVTHHRRKKRRLRTLTADPELLRQLAKIGNNLNQIARAANAAGFAPHDMPRLLAELLAIEQHIHALTLVSAYSKLIE